MRRLPEGSQEVLRRLSEEALMRFPGRFPGGVQEAFRGGAQEVPRRLADEVSRRL